MQNCKLVEAEVSLGLSKLNCGVDTDYVAFSYTKLIMLWMN